MPQTRISDLAATGALDGTELLELSRLSATTRISADTISAAAADNSYNDSANGFVAAGFAVGMRVKVTGFTGDTANNLFVGTITALTAAKMTIGGVDGDVIVDDAAGETVVIAHWISERATAQQLADLASVVGGVSVSVDVAGTAVDLDNADGGKYQRFTNAAAKTFTVRPQATHAVTANSEFHLRNVGAGALTVAAGAGVTINAPAGGTLVVAERGTVTLKRVAENVFDLLGQTVPA